MRLSDWSKWREAEAGLAPKKHEWDREPVPENRRTREKFSESLNDQRTQFDKREIYVWSLFLKSSGAYVGWIDIAKIAREPHQLANLGWFIYSQHRGNGYAKEAVQKLISVAFSDLAFHRLEAVIDLENRASIAVAKSCGLTPEGVRKFYRKRPDGIWADQVVFTTTPEQHYEQASAKARHPARSKASRRT